MNVPMSVVVVLGIAALSAMLTGRGDPGERVQAASPGANGGNLVLKPCAFDTESGRYAADCGTLAVPENRARAGSRRITLPVTRIRAAAGQPAEPIFYLAGGPGMSNMGFKPPAALLANHDFVMVGYRGVDGSAVLGCPEVRQAVRGAGDDALSEQSLANIGQAYQRCAARLQDEGVDLSGYTMPEVVADMEAARAGLGYQRVNLLSESYGTRVAQVYAQQHPDRVFRSVMIGVNPPGRFVWEPDTTDRQLEYYAHLCARDPACTARTADLAETVRQVTHNMPKRWLFLPIDPGKVKVTTFALLFHRDTAAMVFDAYIAAAGGDPSGLALMSLAYDFVVPSSFVWGDLAAKAVSADYDPARDYVTEMDPPGSILGAPMSKLFWGSLQGGVWPAEPIPAEFHQVQPADVETLLVSGTVDFSTPAEFATDELLPYLTHAKQITLAEMGHVNDVWNAQPRATARLLTSFYDTGVADDSLFTHLPAEFGVRLGFPALAKVALGVVLSVMPAVGALAWFVVRRMRRCVARRTSGKMEYRHSA